MSEAGTTTPSIDELLEQSSAEPEFHEAVRNYHSGGGNGILTAGPGCPPVKVLRVISQLLESHPGMRIRTAHVEGRSGCSDFRGQLAVETVEGKHEFEFVWDCAWKAEQAGLTTFWGSPDQQRAAREFGYRCFERFEKVA